MLLNISFRSDLFCKKKVGDNLFHKKLTWAMSFLVQQKFMNVTFTKSAPKHTVIVFSSNVSCEPIVTICLSFKSCNLKLIAYYY